MATLYGEVEGFWTLLLRIMGNHKGFKQKCVARCGEWRLGTLGRAQLQHEKPLLPQITAAMDSTGE